MADDGQDAGSVRLKIELAYDGTGFAGWAAQPGLRTVAGVLAEGLGRVLRMPQPPRLTVAGRTDAGVHARGQVAHSDIPRDIWEHGAWAGGRGVRRAGRPARPGPEGKQGSARAEDLAVWRLTRALPPDLRVRSVTVAPAGFDARFSALWRRYSYRVSDSAATADPLRRGDTLWHQRELDLAAMNEAAALLVGEHDFAAFCRRREGATTIRALRRLDWRRDADGVAVACVVADAFCHNMVRALVGSLLPVGDGSRPPSWPASVLTAAVRDPAVRVVPPHGLCLEEVRYPPPGELAARAGVTRQVRG